jgi:hypothetical protein
MHAHKVHGRRICRELTTLLPFQVPGHFDAPTKVCRSYSIPLRFLSSKACTCPAGLDSPHEACTRGYSRHWRREPAMMLPFTVSRHLDAPQRYVVGAQFLPVFLHLKRVPQLWMALETCTCTQISWPLFL